MPTAGLLPVLALRLCPGGVLTTALRIEACHACPSGGGFRLLVERDVLPVQRHKLPGPGPFAVEAGVHVGTPGVRIRCLNHMVPDEGETGSDDPLAFSFLAEAIKKVPTR